jgi:EAL domain-containing protein (putative c-di-GMP-specific phosphodiesterase class I)
MPVDERGASLVRAIVAMSQSLGLSTIAEGVETEVQRAMLDAIGCTLGQGYLFSPPVPVAQATLLLSAQRPSALPSIPHATLMLSDQRTATTPPQPR